MINLNQISFRDIEYVLAVAHWLHFGRAAQQCGVSQPGLSTQIQKVEDFLGVAIFERNNKKVLLTDAGSRIVKQFQVLFQNMIDLQSWSSTQTKIFAAPVRIGSIASLGPYLLPHFLATLKSQHPTIRLILTEGLTQTLLGQLKAGNLDFVLAADTFEDDSIEKIPLFDEELWAAFSKRHAIAKLKHIHLQDLKASEMVLLEDGHCLKDQVLDLCKLSKDQHLQDIQATSLESLRHMVAAGMGYTLMPKLAVVQDPGLQKLVSYCRVQSTKPLRRTIILCRRKAAFRVAESQELAHIIRQSVKAEALKIYA